MPLNAARECRCFNFHASEENTHTVGIFLNLFSERVWNVLINCRGKGGMLLAEILAGEQIFWSAKTRRNSMNEQIMTGQWKQMQGTLKSWWGRLTDDDLERINGQKDRLIGWVQENYGRTRDEAAREVEARFNEYGGTLGGSAAEIKAKAYEFGGTVANKASEAAAAVKSGADRASSYFHERTFHNMAGDLTALIKKYPVPSLLIGVGLGIWLARNTKH
ncbi:MAG TPA: CsbD family protein [Candidatus Binatia bacterium]|nr:CsbD family protein [Candidatus Binatia bacterium]